MLLYISKTEHSSSEAKEDRWCKKNQQEYVMDKDRQGGGGQRQARGQEKMGKWLQKLQTRGHKKQAIRGIKRQARGLQKAQARGHKKTGKGV